MSFEYLLLIPILFLAILMFIWKYRIAKSKWDRILMVIFFFVLLPLGLYYRYQSWYQELSLDDYKIIDTYETAFDEELINVAGRLELIRLPRLKNIDNQKYAVRLLKEAREDGMTYRELQETTAKIKQNMKKENPH